MNKVEYKKINYIFSINSSIEENVSKLKFTNETILFINKMLDFYNRNIDVIIKNYKLDLNAKKKILEAFLNKIPKELIILRNHVKNCLYVNTISDFEFKINILADDFKRLKLVKIK